MTDKARADRVEATMADYLHRGKRMVVTHFGPDVTHDHNLMAVNLATAMATMDTMETLADRKAEAPLKLTPNRGGS